MMISMADGICNVFLLPSTSNLIGTGRSPAIFCLGFLLPSLAFLKLRLTVRGNGAYNQFKADSYKQENFKANKLYSEFLESGKRPISFCKMDSEVRAYVECH